MERLPSLRPRVLQTVQRTHGRTPRLVSRLVAARRSWHREGGSAERASSEEVHHEILVRARNSNGKGRNGRSRLPADDALKPPPEESRLKIDPRYCVSDSMERLLAQGIQHGRARSRHSHPLRSGDRRQRGFLFGHGLPLGWAAVQDSSEVSEMQVQMKLKVISERAEPAGE